MAAAAAAHTDHAAARGRIDVRCVAADKTLIAAAGPPWHKAQRARGERPKGVDGEASWSRSAHDGWVYGYGLEAVVTAPRRGVIWPLIASADPAHGREAKTFPGKPPRLPARTRYVLVDMGYDSNDLGEVLEYDDGGRRTGRRLVGPQQLRHNRYGGRKQVWRETAAGGCGASTARSGGGSTRAGSGGACTAAGQDGRAVLRSVQGVVRSGGARLARRAGEQPDADAGGSVALPDPAGLQPGQGPWEAEVKWILDLL